MRELAEITVGKAWDEHFSKASQSGPVTPVSGPLPLLPIPPVNRKPSDALTRERSPGALALPLALLKIAKESQRAA